MNKSITLNKKAVTAKTVTIFTAVAAAVLLPQLFHVVGVLSGTGAAIGSALLPMHIPVLLAGFMGGPIIGAVVGILSPLVSFAVSGMPTAVILPFMIIELGAYGLISGLLSHARINSFIKLVITQLAGRIARALAILTAIYLFGNTQLTVASVREFIIAGLFGILLQWALIPLLCSRMNGLKKLYE